MCTLYVLCIVYCLVYTLLGPKLTKVPKHPDWKRKPKLVGKGYLKVQGWQKVNTGPRLANYD